VNLRLGVAVLLVAGTAVAQPSPVPPPPSPPSFEAQLGALQAELDRRMGEERAAIAALKSSLDAAERERRALAVDVQRLSQRLSQQVSELAPTVAAGRFGLTLSGFVQVDGVFYRQSSVDDLDPSTQQPLNETRFLVRRARLRADLDYRFIFGALELDANTVNGPQVRPISFEVGVRYKNPNDPKTPYIAVHMGLVRTPFGFEVQQSDRDRLFLERSNVAQAFFPGEYDLGLRVYGGWRFLRYAIGAMNGDPIGERLFPGRDPNQSKDFVGRVGVDFGFFKRFGLAAGFSAVYGQGFHRPVATGKDTVAWRDFNQNGVVDPGELQPLSGQVAEPAANFARYAIGGDLRLTALLPRLGTLTIYAELVYGSNMDRNLQIADPIAALRDIRELGYYIGFTAELSPYAMVGLRYDGYDADRDATRQVNAIPVPRTSQYSTLAATVAGRLPRYGRLILEYDHNTNPLGRKADGTPTTLADDSLTLRGEVTF